MSESPPGRRILVAIVTGDVGDAIQRWRTLHDPDQARRIPPHTTLAYWAPTVDPDVMQAQVRHALPAQLSVRLGPPRTFSNRDQTLYMPVLETAMLDQARTRLYDATHLPLEKGHDWEWHVTCVRYARDQDASALRDAAPGLPAGSRWTIDTVSYMELQGDRYEPVATWKIDP